MLARAFQRNLTVRNGVIPQYSRKDKPKAKLPLPSITKWWVWVRRLKITKHGLTAAQDLPKNAGELTKLSKRCEMFGPGSVGLLAAYRARLKIAETFKFEGSKWWFVTPGGGKSTIALNNRLSNEPSRHPNGYFLGRGCCVQYRVHSAPVTALGALEA
jgi:hypothetical protein